MYEAVSARLLSRQELESGYEVLARAMRRGVRPKHLRLAGVRAVLYEHDPVRLPPIALTAARRLPPVTLRPVLERDRPDVVFWRTV